jgi:hypothetical protein
MRCYSSGYMLQSRRFFILLIICVVALLACSGKKPDAGNPAGQVTGLGQGATSESSSSLVKTRIFFFKGRLVYGGAKDEIPLNSIPQLLSLYSDEELVGVTELNLSQNEIANIQGLNRLPNLKILRLGYNQLERISGLENSPNLEILSLGHNRIARIEGLDYVTALRELYLESNRIEKIENLSHLRKLEVLILNWNRIRKLEGLRGLQSLRWLEVGANPLENFSEILELKNVRSMTIAGPENVIDDEDRRVFQEWNRQHPEEQLDSEGVPLSSKKPKPGS